MTKFSKTDLDITEYKPKMKPVYVTEPRDLCIIPYVKGQTTVQVKADGEFNYIYMDRHQIYAVNRFGRKTEDLPALKELHMQFLKGNDMLEAEVLAEIYAEDENGKPLSLPTLVHYLKGDDKSLHNRIHLGLFELLRVDGLKGSTFNSVKRFAMLSKFNGKLCHVLEYIVPKNFAEVMSYYTQKVQNEGWEGLVIRTNGDTYKAKPNRDIDAVIIGINKTTKGYEKGIAKSVKVALMPTEGSFVELGDATIPSEAEAREVYALTRVKVNETDSTVFVKPLVIVRISYISLFPDTMNRVYKLLLGGFTEVGTMQLARMKSPRVVGYRRDKKVCVADVGLNQIEE